VSHTDCVLEADLREILNSSNKTCTIVYKQTKWHDDGTHLRSHDQQELYTGKVRQGKRGSV